MLDTELAMSGSYCTENLFGVVLQRGAVLQNDTSLVSGNTQLDISESEGLSAPPQPRLVTGQQDWEDAENL